MQEVLTKRGHQVETLDGKRSGTIVAIFTAPGGERRVVVNVDGALRIFSLDELRAFEQFGERRAIENLTEGRGA